MSTVPALLQTIKPGRTIVGASAVLLPFLDSGKIDEVGFSGLLKRTFDAGLTPAVNMDTGYMNLLETPDRLRVLEITKDIAQGRPFIAGTFIEDKAGDPFTLYKTEIETNLRFGGIPIIFPCSATKKISEADLVALYKKLGAVTPRFLGFELGEMFVPFGRIFELSTVAELMQIPTLSGMKHSSLERELELDRLALRDKTRPEFNLYTGNDLAIDLVMYGSDYLLGLSAFYPEAFALRDKLWAKQDVGFYQLNDLIQYLGFLAFRAPVPSYKHNAAQFLHLRGFDRNQPHARQGGDPARLRYLHLANILERLDKLVAEYTLALPN